MIKVILICAKNYDAFACSVANDIQKAADKINFEISCASMTTAELHLLPTDTDLILFAPPRYRHLDRIKKICPHAKISMIDFKTYALRDGNAILNFIQKILQRL